MGRKKLSMELITKDKSRNITYKKRKEGLIRKMHEFTTLCDVSACMIIYGPRQEPGRSVEPEIWPSQNHEEVQRIIQLYKSKNKDLGNKTYTLSDFFLERKRKVEDELAKLKRKNIEAKYPIQNPKQSDMEETDLRDFASALALKIELVKARIEVLKMSRNGLLNNNAFMDYARPNQSPHFYSPNLIEMMNPQATAPPLHHHYQLLHHPNPNSIEQMNHDSNPNSMMRFVMNDPNNVVNYDHGHYMQFGNPLNASGNMQFKREVVLEPNPVTLGRYYALPPHIFSQVPMPAPPYAVAAQPLCHGGEDNNGPEDLLQMNGARFLG